MNKTELIAAIAAKSELTKADSGRALAAVLDTLSETMAKGESVTLIGFGTFKTSQRAAREGKNPQTGEKLQIAAATVPRFTAGASLKAKVNPVKPAKATKATKTAKPAKKK